MFTLRPESVFTMKQCGCSRSTRIGVHVAPEYATGTLRVFETNYNVLFRPFLTGIPRHDTIARVLCKLKPEEVEQAFHKWVNGLIDVTDCEVIAINGKTARRSFDTRHRRNPLHSVSAWCCEHQLVLGQKATSEKSNEITAKRITSAVCGEKPLAGRKYSLDIGHDL